METIGSPPQLSLFLQTWKNIFNCITTVVSLLELSLLILLSVLLFSTCICRSFFFLKMLLLS
uniref:Putative ovule protein n=1 Tax=Solanum chacoense TaxID=4108 RepID=A0A0V0GSX4_SOLCH